MYKELGIYFLYYNLQFIFDILYKKNQIVFLETWDINIFILFNFYNFICVLLNIYEKTLKIKYLEIPTKSYIFKNISSKIKNMSKKWVEENSITKIETIISTSQTYYNNKYNLIIELYGSIIRTLVSSYMMYILYNNSIQILLTYFSCYLSFYYFVILNNRTIINNNNKENSKYNLMNKNLYLTYFNSCIGSYEDKYFNLINKNNNNMLKCNLENENIDKYYLGGLQISQKLLVFIFTTFYLNSNTKTHSMLLLPLYQNIVTLVYQFEYILHNINCLIKANNIHYNDFMNDYKNELISYNQTTNFPHIRYNIDYKNKYSIDIDYNFNINNNDRILIQGKSGIGKSSLCKVLSGYFKNYIINISDRILYITQNIYLYSENRTLYNIITENDLNLNRNDSKLFEIILKDIIPFDDIIDSFDLDYKNIKLTNKSFSGGQEKRIYLAKWLYHLILNINNYDILILDEPDKSLDKETFNKLLNNILTHDYFKNICIIIVSHNIENTDLFNKILNIEKINNKLIIN